MKKKSFFDEFLEKDESVPEANQESKEWGEEMKKLIQNQYDTYFK